MSESFIQQLRETIRSLKRMRPNEVHVISVDAHYGRYQIVIGPEEQDMPQRRSHRRPIEVNGEIHHLFLSPHAIRIYPSKHQVMHNMKDTVILRDLSVHLRDPDGNGKHLDREGENALHPRECINLAGNEGEQLIEQVEHDRQMTMATYRIIQRDILKALKEGRKKPAA